MPKAKLTRDRERIPETDGSAPPILSFPQLRYPLGLLIEVCSMLTSPSGFETLTLVFALQTGLWRFLHDYSACCYMPSRSAC